MPALGVNPRFIDDLADAVLEALPYVGAMAAPPGASAARGGALADGFVDAIQNLARAAPAAFLEMGPKMGPSRGPQQGPKKGPHKGLKRGGKRKPDAKAGH